MCIPPKKDGKRNSIHGIWLPKQTLKDFSTSSQNPTQDTRQSRTEDFENFHNLNHSQFTQIKEALLLELYASRFASIPNLHLFDDIQICRILQTTISFGIPLSPEERSKCNEI